MAQPSVTVARNDGSSTVVTASYPGIALDAAQTNSMKLSYVNASGTSVEATLVFPGYAPLPQQE